MIVEDLVLRLRGIVDPSAKGIGKVATEAAAAVAALAAALSALTIASASTVRAQARLAEGLGETVQTVQELGFAFRRFGADEEDVGDALATIADRAEDAKGGMQSFIDDFALVGVTVDDLRNRRPSEIFEAFVEGASKVDDANKRAAAAVRIFGDDLGRKLLPILTRGTGALQDLKDEARDLGVVVDDETSEAAEALTDGFDALTARVGGLATGLGLRLIPTGRILVRELGRILDVVQPLITKGFDALAYAVERAAEALETPGGRIVALLIGGAGAVGLAGAVSSAAASIPILGAALVGLGSVLSGLAIPAAVLTAIALALDDINAAAEGQASLTGTLADKLGVGGETRTALSGFKDLLLELGDAFDLLADSVAESVGRMIPDLGVIEGIAGTVGPVLDYFDALGREKIDESARGRAEFLTESGEAMASAARGFSLASRYAAGESGIRMDYAGMTEINPLFGLQTVSAQVMESAFQRRGESLGTSPVSYLDTLPPVSVNISAGPSSDEIARAAGSEVERQVRSALAEAGG